MGRASGARSESTKFTDADAILLERLEAEELELLREPTYEREIRVRGTREIKIAERLIRRRLLEQNPTADGLVVRPTSRGEMAARAMSEAMVWRTRDEIARLSEDDREAASSTQSALYHRLAIEAACGDIPSGALKRIAKIVSLPVGA